MLSWVIGIWMSRIYCRRGMMIRIWLRVTMMRRSAMDLSSRKRCLMAINKRTKYPLIRKMKASDRVMERGLRRKSH
jgi:hypothetical protein